MNQELLKKEVLYRATHRGCKETDILLGKFVETYINDLTETDISRIKEILECDDSDIYTWCCYPELTPPKWQHMFRKLASLNETN